MQKLQNNQKKMKNYEILNIFNQKIKNLTGNYIFHNFYDDVISVDVRRCVRFRVTIVQKRFAIGQEVKILGQKKLRGACRTPTIPPPCPFDSFG